MRIIFIRHGDPDYVNDALTEKGVREAKLLAKRVAKWDFITQVYCSPLGRAAQTASYSLAALGREAVTYEWMKEFSYMIDDPVTGRHGVPWDFMPEYWTAIPQMYDRHAWRETDIYRSNPDLIPAYDEVCRGLDGILSSYGYERRQDHYINTNPATVLQNTIVIFCHLGVTCVMMSHLLGISPALLFHDLYLAPTSVTVLATEERMNHIAHFRAQVIGDTNHLQQGGEPISAAGYFTDPFQG
ncbi:MAG: histidine phosphatase family protein [Bacteroidales bacterium]|nr:histidine phosphatase family protein [Bacteroidales bacterium]MCM1416342.1 histidine phosphatase family protein [bacterium]MCM1423561.1 histidine phosphatase family protein [bacterium]